MVSGVPVVDDDADARLTLTTMLEQFGAVTIRRRVRR